jgi:serine protease inhibitor
LTVVLPAGGGDVLQLESELAQDPEALDAAMKPAVGDLELPKIRIQSETDLAAALRQRGVHNVFRNLDFVSISGSPLTGVAQKIDLEINQQGIRGNAGTVVNGV